MPGCPIKKAGPIFEDGAREGKNPSGWIGKSDLRQQLDPYLLMASIDRDPSVKARTNSARKAEANSYDVVDSVFRDNLSRRYPT